MSTAGVTLESVWEHHTPKSQVAELYEAHRDEIYRFLITKRMSPGDAQEATQDVFINLHKALKEGVAIQSPRAWLYKVAGRTAIDYWQRHHHERSSIPLDSGTTPHLSSEAPSPEQVAAERQRLRLLAAGLARLPGDQLLCFQLRTKGLRYREIAEVMKIPISTVADKLTKAVMFLREVCSQCDYNREESYHPD